jgi:membrane protease YdiL (CAAX protease family)
VKLQGSWERRGRNPLVGTLVLVAGLGALYFLVQSLVLNGYILVDLLRGGGGAGEPGENVLEAIARVYRRYRPAILIVLAATQLLIFLLPPLLFIPRWHTAEVGRYLRFRRFPLSGLALSVAGTLFLLPLAVGLGQWLYSFFPELARWNEAMEPLIVDPRPWPLAATVLVIAVVPALCEEVLFRGYFQGTLERRLSAPWHFLVSGTVFALFHQQVLSLLSLLLVGIYLGYVFFRFRSIYLTMICHFLYNASLILLSNFPPQAPTLLNAEGGLRWPLPIGAAALFAAVIFGMVRVRPRHEPES